MNHTNRNRLLNCGLTAVWSLLFSFSVHAEPPLLMEDFSGAPLNSAIWGLATWNIGDRTQFGNTPEFKVEDEGEGTVDYISLPLDTYNPNLPGQRVLGTEIFSLEKFDNTGGIEYLARARLNTVQKGLVAAFFTYTERRRKGRTESDEIDFEVLSNKLTSTVLVTSWNDWGAPGSDYGDVTHHLGSFVEPYQFNWHEWTEYAIRGYPDRVEWWVNGKLVRLHTSPVPDDPQPIRASLWAAGTTWTEAFDISLAPVFKLADNSRFSWDIDYIVVTHLGGGDPGGGNPPAAPTGLSATVIGNNVQLSWTDAASDETAYTIYRAWKPKGNASPDFKTIANLSANVTTYLDTPSDGQHLYRVTASNAGGESPASNTVTVSVGSGGKGGKPPNT